MHPAEDVLLRLGATRREDDDAVTQDAGELGEPGLPQTDRETEDGVQREDEPTGSQHELPTRELTPQRPADVRSQPIEEPRHDPTVAQNAVPGVFRVTRRTTAAPATSDEAAHGPQRTRTCGGGGGWVSRMSTRVSPSG